MKSFIKHLFFDKDLVQQISSIDYNKDRLYNALNAGKITLKEYLRAIKSSEFVNS